VEGNMLQLIKAFCAGIPAVILAAGISTALAQPAANAPAGRAGALLQAEPMANAPFGSTAYRVLYRSTGLDGEPITVSGVVVVPSGPTSAQAPGIVAWAHPTTGVVTRCAPSLRPNVFSSIPGLRDLLQRGFIVTATDYPGLGTPGPHPYLVGVSEGRAVLDSVRAARALVGSAAGARFALWGHSQGGHAVLFAGQLARRYAPELELVGLAAAAPATELATLFDDDISTPSGKILTSMALWSWSRVYGARLDNVVDPDVMATVNRLANDCVESLVEVIGMRFAERPLQSAFLKVNDLTEVQPWRRLMAQNTPRASSGGAPVFLAQGTADKVVDPAVTLAFAGGLCTNGVPVNYVIMPGVIHAFIAHRSADMATAWIAARFTGEPAPSNCRAP
jgi:acetyl esterase/lipase